MVSDVVLALSIGATPISFVSPPIPTTKRIQSEGGRATALLSTCYVQYECEGHPTRGKAKHVNTLSRLHDVKTGEVSEVGVGVRDNASPPNQRP